jgi:hypothetical protein
MSSQEVKDEVKLGNTPEMTVSRPSGKFIGFLRNLPSNAFAGLGALGPALLSSLYKVKKFFYHPRLKGRLKQDILTSAEDPKKAHLHWHASKPLSEAKNAHYTNRPKEMLNALQGEHNFLEGDVHLGWGVRYIPGVNLLRSAIMAHHPHQLDGLRFKEWLHIGKLSGRGVKIDIKQAAAIPKIIRNVKASDISQERLIFNMDVIQGPHSYPRFLFPIADIMTGRTPKMRQVRRIRENFPKATIALGAVTGPQPAGTVYSDKQLGEFREWARELGGPITFKLRAEFVNQHVVETLKPFGSISIWNDAGTFNPPDVDAEIRRFRDLGVDGMIDLIQAKPAP